MWGRPESELLAYVATDETVQIAAVVLPGCSCEVREWKEQPFASLLGVPTENTSFPCKHCSRLNSRHFWLVPLSQMSQCFTGWLGSSSSTLFLFRPLSHRINEASTYYLKYIVLTAGSMPYNSLVMADFKTLRLETGKWNKVEVKDMNWVLVQGINKG